MRGSVREGMRAEGKDVAEANSVVADANSCLNIAFDTILRSRMFVQPFGTVFGLFTLIAFLYRVEHLPSAHLPCIKRRVLNDFSCHPHALPSYPILVPSCLMCRSVSLSLFSVFKVSF